VYADNEALPAFARRTRVVKQSIDNSNKSAAVGLLLWAHAGTDGRTERESSERTDSGHRTVT